MQLLTWADTSTAVTTNAEFLMHKPKAVCSGYDSAVCHDLTDKYAHTNYPALLFGLFKISGDAIVTLGLNTGFDSPKLSVSPSISWGGARRWYLSDDKTSHIVIEGNYWAGAVVTHRPCLDSYARSYYCPALTAWSDFSYDDKPQSYNLKVWYEVFF